MVFNRKMHVAEGARSGEVSRSARVRQPTACEANQPYAAIGARLFAAGMIGHEQAREAKR